MKVKLIDVEGNPSEELTGTCELCFGTMYCDNPVYVFKSTNSNDEVRVDGYWWEYGCYDEVAIPNIINFADWLDHQKFPNDTKLDTDWLIGVVDEYCCKYTGYRDAHGREIKVGDILCVSLKCRGRKQKSVFKAPVEVLGSFGWRSHGVTWKQKYIELDELINYRDYLDEHDKSPEDIIWARVTIDKPAHTKPTND